MTFIRPACCDEPRSHDALQPKNGVASTRSRDGGLGATPAGLPVCSHPTNGLYKMAAVHGRSKASHTLNPHRRKDPTRHRQARYRAMEGSHEIHDGPAAGGGGDGGGLGVLQPIELGDRRLQAAAFLLAWGCSIIIYGTVLNRSTNPDHIFVGFILFTIGAGLALLTLGGGGRAAARIEEFLRGFF